jgi:predicted DNA-binding transcriptional regulator AlpA
MFKMRGKIFMEKINELEDLFLTVEQVTKILKLEQSTIYAYTAERGKKGGKKGKRFPSDIYIKVGRNIRFIKEKFIQWALSGAVLV